VIQATRADIGERYSSLQILKEGRIFIAPIYRERFSDSVKKFRRPFAVALYTKLGVTMDRIAEGFHAVGLPMSTKTVSVWVGRERTRGFDIYRNRQTYSWTKFKGKLYRLWVRGKISQGLFSIFRAFLAWIYYYQMTGIFDLDAALRGEEPP